MTSLDSLPTFSLAVKAVLRASQKSGVNLRYEDTEEIANDCLLRFAKAVEAGKPYQDSRPIWQIARNLVIDFSRKRRPVEVALADISLPWTTIEKAQATTTLLVNKWPAKERKVVEAIKAGVPPTPKHLHEATGLPVEQTKRLLRKVRDTLRTAAIAELDEAIRVAVHRMDFSTKPELLTVPVNTHHRAQLYVQFHRRCLAYSLSASDSDAAGALFYGANFPVGLSQLNKRDPLLQTFFLLSEARSQLRSFELHPSDGHQVLFACYIAFKSAKYSNDRIALSEAAELGQALSERIESININDRLHFLRFTSAITAGRSFADAADECMKRPPDYVADFLSLFTP